MWLKNVVLLLHIYCFVDCRNSVCTRHGAIIGFKRPAYDFSVRLLDRISEEEGNHFVFSPLSTWMQLTTLADGATDSTLAEISKVTRHNRVLCNRRRLKDFLRDVNDIHKLNVATSSVMIIDKLYNVKSKFKMEAERGNVKVLLLDFNKQEESAKIANKAISIATNGAINEVVSPEDFTDNTMLIADSVVFKSLWKYPFNKAYTTRMMFYTEEKVRKGEVNMMSQVGYFHLSTILMIKAKILELPCADDKMSMLIFLPTHGGSIANLFFSLKDIRVASIFNEFKRESKKLVSVVLPRFKISTEVGNLPELLADMGIRSIFYPDRANFSGISDYKVHASVMAQVAEIEVTEEGVSAFAAEFLMKEQVEEFIANRPFGFMFVDKETHVILCAGVYSNPELF